MRILGIDPGLQATGYGVVDVLGARDFRLVEAGLIRTPKTQSLPERLQTIGQQMVTLLESFTPDTMAVEDLYSYYKTPKPAILMGHVRGVLLEKAAAHKLGVSSYLPTKVKQAVVGQGHATKEQVSRMVRVHLQLNDKQVRADVTDALAVALCHATSLLLRSEHPEKSLVLEGLK